MMASLDVSTTHVAQESAAPAGKEEKPLHFDPKAAHKTLTQWCKETRTMRAAHSEAAVTYGRISRGMGATVAILSAAVGTSAFSQLTTNGPEWVTITAGVVGLLAAALAAAQTALGFGALKETHKTAASKQAQLHIEMEELATAIVKNNGGDDGNGWERFGKEFDRISKEYGRANAEAPEIANRFVTKARRNLDARPHW